MGSDTVKLITLPDGNKVLTSSGTVTPNAKAILVTDAKGNPVIHQSGVPKSGTTALMGTDTNGNQIVLLSGDDGLDPLVPRMWSNLTGSKIYARLLEDAYIFEMDITIGQFIPDSPRFVWYNTIGGIRYNKKSWVASEQYGNPYREYRSVEIGQYPGLYYEMNPFIWGKYVDTYYNQTFQKNNSIHDPISLSFLKSADVIPGSSMRSTTNQGALFHDRFGTFFCAGEYSETPKIIYITKPILEYYYGEPIIVGPLEPLELDLFPSEGIISFKINDGPNMYHFDGTPFYKTFTGVYYSKSNNSLNQVHSFTQDYKEDINIRTELRFDVGAPITLSHTFAENSEDIRITKFMYYSRSGDQYAPSRSLVTKIKTDIALPDEGILLLTIKERRLEDGDLFKKFLVRKYYLDEDGWIRFHHIEVREIQPFSDYTIDLGTGGIYYRIVSVYPYLHDSNSATFSFLGHEYYEGTGADIEVEIEEDWDQQIFVRLIEEVESNPHYGVRFYHDDLFSGVQTNLYPSTINVGKTPVEIGHTLNIWRVESIPGTTYILSTGRKDISYRELWKVKLPGEFYQYHKVKTGRYPIVENELLQAPEGYNFLEIISLGNTLFAYCVNKIHNMPSAIFHGGGGGWTMLREIKPIQAETDITNIIRVYTNYSCAYSAINGNCAFFLIPEQQFIAQGAYPYHIYVSSYYSLYRISNTLEVHKYSFSAPGYPSDPIGILDNENLIRTPIPKPAIQMICYDSMEPKPPFEKSLFPGTTYIAIRYLENYGDEIEYPGAMNPLPLRRFEIPHELMSVVP